MERKVIKTSLLKKIQIFSSRATGILMLLIGIVFFINGITIKFPANNRNVAIIIAICIFLGLILSSLSTGVTIDKKIIIEGNKIEYYVKNYCIKSMDIIEDNVVIENDTGYFGRLRIPYVIYKLKSNKDFYTYIHDWLGTDDINSLKNILEKVNYENKIKFSYEEDVSNRKFNIPTKEIYKYCRKNKVLKIIIAISSIYAFLHLFTFNFIGFGIFSAIIVLLLYRKRKYEGSIGSEIEIYNRNIVVDKRKYNVQEIKKVRLSAPLYQNIPFGLKYIIIYGEDKKYLTVAGANKITLFLRKLRIWREEGVDSMVNKEYPQLFDAIKEWCIVNSIRFEVIGY